MNIVLVHNLTFWSSCTVYSNTTPISKELGRCVNRKFYKMLVFANKPPARVLCLYVKKDQQVIMFCLIHILHTIPHVLESVLYRLKGNTHDRGNRGWGCTTIVFHAIAHIQSIWYAYFRIICYLVKILTTILCPRPSSHIWEVHGGWGGLWGGGGSVSIWLLS